MPIDQQPITPVPSGAERATQHNNLQWARYAASRKSVTPSGVAA